MISEGRVVHIISRMEFAEAKLAQFFDDDDPDALVHIEDARAALNEAIRHSRKLEQPVTDEELGAYPQCLTDKD
jgi:hypothetical protein